MAGFPAPRLVRALVQLAPKSNAAFQHWGDADVGGLSTYYFLRPHLACPLMLRRTTADWVTSEPSFGADLYRWRITRSAECVRSWRTEALDVDSARRLID